MANTDRRSANVLVGVSGGIAAYKVCEVVSNLAKAGVSVRVIMTQAAETFVSALTFATLSRQAAYSDRDFWAASNGRPLHIELGEWADLLVIAPLSANTMGKLACGLADNLLTNTVLASVCPVLLAPAMNTDMWLQAAVQENWQRLLQSSRYHTAGPGAGRLACDRIGTGRMAEPGELLAAIYSLQHSGGRRDLQGRRILISTGSTQEYLDAVRYLGNPSTGRMGIALAQAASYRGASVSLVHGPVDPALLQPLPQQVQRTAATSAAEMQAALVAQMDSADWVIMAAAVADLRPVQSAAGKLPKDRLPNPLPLEPVPDIVAGLVKQKRPGQYVLGFAAQTGEITAPAQEKLRRKGLDAIVANPIDQPDAGFASDRNAGVIFDAKGHRQALKAATKLAVAHQIFDYLSETA